MLLATSNILRPVTGMGLLIVEQTSDAELFRGGSIPAGPVSGARGLMTKYSIQPVAMLGALGWIRKILILANVCVSPGVVAAISYSLIFTNPN